ncbi:MAG: DUF2807 domain-containing protein [Pseudomonadota bacterium]
MNKSLLTGGCALAIASAGAAHADETRDFNFDAFDRIDAAAGVVVEVVVGGEQSVRVETDRGDFSDLIIGVENGELNVKRDWKKNGWRRRKPNYTVYATVAELSGVEASSGSTVEATGVSGGDFDLDTSSGASVSIAGDCDTVKAEASSGSSIDARDLECASAVADASSGASIAVHAKEDADAEASSGASVTVYGGPSDVRADKSSGGSVRIRD